MNTFRIDDEKVRENSPLTWVLTSTLTLTLTSTLTFVLTLTLTLKAVIETMDNDPFDIHIVVDMTPNREPPPPNHSTGPFKESPCPILRQYGEYLTKLAAEGQGTGRLATVTYLSQLNPRKHKEARLEAEAQWTKFGAENSVRVVIMRVADRVMGPENSALVRVAHPENDINQVSPCRAEDCTRTEPLTRINIEDFSAIVKRMISMFALVEIHGRCGPTPHPFVNTKTPISHPSNRNILLGIKVFPGPPHMRLLSPASPTAKS